MKNNNDHEKRKSFVSTFTETPPQFDSFTTTLKEVLDWESKITELKYSAKKAESLVIGWIDFCDNIGFYAFHRYLLDAFEHRQPVVKYIRNMPSDVRTKNIRELKQLRLKCNQDINIPQAINICYVMQNEITETLSQAHTDVTKSLSQEIFQWQQEEVFWWDVFFDAIMEKEEQHDKEVAFYKAFIDSIQKKYYFTSKGVLVPKALFKSAKEKLSDLGENR